MPTLRRRAQTGDMTIQSIARMAYLGAALIGAMTLGTLVARYPYEDVSESIGKFAATTALVTGALCLLATFRRKPIVSLAALFIIGGAAGVAWAAELTALPSATDVLGDPANDLRMVAAGCCAGGALALTFASLFRTGFKRPLHALFGLLHVVLGGFTALVLVSVAPASYNVGL